MSDEPGSTLDEAVARTESAFQAAHREYEALPRSAPKARRVELLHSWNDAARDYFTACITAVGSPASRYARDAPMWAADWLRYAAIHYAAVRREVERRSLGLDIERLKPGFVKFDVLQRLVKDPAIARDLRNELIAAGLATYGFDEQNDTNNEQRTDRSRWFAFGCVLFAVAVAFAGWGFALGNLTEPQRDILIWILPLSSGFAASAFAGAITVKARGLLPGSVIVATGGFAVWLIASFILFPKPSPVPTSFVLQLNGEPGILGKSFEVDLGSVEPDKITRFTLGVRLDSGNARFAVGATPDPISVSSFGDINLSSRESFTTAVELKAGPPMGPQVKEVTLLTPTTVQSGQKPLVVTVRWQALPSGVAINAHSGPRPSGRGQDSSQPYEVCASAPTTGDYVLSSGRHWLTGDRACGDWSTCTARQETSKYCLVFTLQGHNECLSPFSNCDPIRSSEGHVEAAFQLRPSKPRLKAA